MVSQIVATFSKKPVFGYLGMAYAMVAISIIWWRISTTCCRSSSPSVPLRAAGMGTRTFRTSTQLRERSPPRSMASRDRHQINRSGRTGDEIARIIHETRPSADVEVVSNPEFLREGAAIQDFKHPDRIVVGTEGDRARKLMAEIYRPLYLNKAPILFTDRRTAELIKYAANAFLATKITFINEIADLAEEVGADVQEEVARGIGLDNRIGSKFLHPGPGFGGSCFPKDTRALLKTAQDHEVPLRVVEAVIAANDVRKRAMARKVAAAFGGSLRGKTIAVLGLTFKPNTDDMREAPSIPLITALHDMGARVRAFDPAGMDQAKALLPDVTFCDGPYTCADGADGLVIVTEWEQFRALDLAEIKQRMACPVLIDLRNIYSGDDIRKYGFVYVGIGRSATTGGLRL
jgi:UDPglucose 6-dehydrogenase